MSDALSASLKSVFGYDSFRPLQREIMEAFLDGQDVLAVLPTGAGKSLCFQLPALVRGGLTLVVSPLIALMKDQVDALQSSGVAATFLNSALDAMEVRHRRSLLNDGSIRLLYAAPERIMTDGFIADLQRWGVNAIAIDEAHCISEWGHDFRPEYRQMVRLREALPGIPVIALTATATDQVRRDIRSQLRLTNARCFLGSFNRPNLTYSIVPRGRTAEQLTALVRQWPEAAGIVYTQSRRGAEQAAAVLRDAGISALPYHAGLDAAERAGNQERFIRDEVRVICATIAFGMGINKPDVRFVIHADLPRNIEGYYQETGRAGRDGLPSECVLMFSRGDIVKNLRFLESMEDDALRRVQERQLRQMADFANGAGCRRAALLAYFGETWTGGNCGSCDVCLNPAEETDVTREAQMFLSCLFRIRAAGGFDTGLNHVVDVLTGRDSEKVRKWGHERLTTWAIGKERPRDDWFHLARELLRLGLAAESEDFYRTVGLTDSGRRFLLSRQSLSVRAFPAASAVGAAAAKPKSGADASRAGSIACDEELFSSLRSARKRLADERSVPPYVIFSDVALRHMARRYPVTDDEFLAIPGVGAKKHADFGRVFMDEIRLWLESRPRLTFPGDIPAAVPRTVSPPSLASLERYRAGHSIDDIAAGAGLKRGTICKHLADAIEAGKLDASPRDFYTVEVESAITGVAETHGLDSLGKLHEALGGRVGYEALHFYRAFARRQT